MSIFDTVRDSVAAVGVSQKVSYATNTMKLNNMIKNKERDIDMLACTIGRDYVTRHLDEIGGDYDSELQSIRNLKEEISQYTQQLEQLKAEQEEARRKAQEERQSREEARRQQKAYSAYTGSQEPVFQTEAVSEQPEEENVKHCPKCGGANELDAKFCVHCGNAL